MPKDFDKSFEGSGGGKSGGGPPSEAENTLRSNHVLRLIEVLCEGPIKGVDQVYFNETPLTDDNGDANFEGVEVNYRLGLPDQAAIPGYTSQEADTVIDAPVVQATPVIRTITDALTDSCRVVVKLPALFRYNDEGDMLTASVSYSIQFRPSGGSWTDIPGSPVQIEDQKNTAPVYLAHRFDLTGSAPWDIRVVRVSDDSDENTKLQNSVSFFSFAQIIDQKLSYRNTALLGIKANAQQFGDKIPTRAALVDGLICEVPSNFDTDARTYSGMWDGTFKNAWTDCPAWCLRELIRHRRFGLGDYMDVAFLDDTTLYGISVYSAAQVDDGQGSTEPRFTFNAYISTAQEAYDLINAMVSVFRGMVYWSLGTALFTSDQPTEPVLSVVRANTVGGDFNYSGASLLSVHNRINVTYNEPSNFYKREIVTVDDPEHILKYGLRTKDIIAFGCTSRSQAIRAGRWLMYTERMESDVLTYAAGQDHVNVLPGNVVRVMDPSTHGVSLGGRVADYGTTTITLDREVTLEVGETYELTVHDRDTVLHYRTVTSAPGALTELTVDVALPELTENPYETVWLLRKLSGADSLYRVLTMREVGQHQYEITALQHSPDKYAVIENGYDIPSYPLALLPTGPLPVPSNFRVVEQVSKVSGSEDAPALGVHVTRSADPRVRGTKVYYKRKGQEWQVFDMGTESTFVISPAIVGAKYLVYLKNYDVLGQHSKATNQRVILVSGVPVEYDVPNSTNFSITPAIRALSLRWTPPVLANYAGLEVYTHPTLDEQAATLVEFSAGSGVVIADLGPEETVHVWTRTKLHGTPPRYAQLAYRGPATTLKVQAPDIADGAVGFDTLGQSAVDAIDGAAQSAAADKAAAEAAAAAAEAAEAAAQAAQLGSEDAQALAASAATAAEAARVAALAAQTAAGNHSGTAQTAATNAGTAQGLAEAAAAAAVIHETGAGQFASQSEASNVAAGTSESAAAASETAAAASETSAAGSASSAQTSSNLTATALASTLTASAALGPVDFGVPDHWVLSPNLSPWPRPAAEGSSTAVFLTNDPDFGNALDFGSDLNYNIGPNYLAPWAPETVFEVVVRYKVNDGASPSDGSDIRVGFTLLEGFNKDDTATNLQFVSSKLTAADGIITLKAWLTLRDISGLDAVTNGYTDGVYTYTGAMNNANNNSASFHVRSSGTGSGWLILDYMQVRDITPYIDALEAAGASAVSAAASALSSSTAAASESAAGQSASASNVSALAADTSEGNASASETAAALSETNASGSENAAASSASVAASSETAAGGSATGAAGSATDAAGSASGAVTSANAASGSANTAQTKANEAGASASQAAASATLSADSETAAGQEAAASAVSALAAASSSSAAGASATLSDASSLEAIAAFDGAVSARRDQLPSDFSEDTLYWTGNFNLPPDDTNDLNSGEVTFVDDVGLRVARAEPVGTGGGLNIAHKGMIVAQDQRTYEVSVTFKQVAGPTIAGGSAVRLFVRGYAADWVTNTNPILENLAVSGLDVWETYTFQFTQSGITNNNTRAFINFNRSFLTNGEVFHISHMSYKDVTDSAASEAAALASSGSASAAQASATASGQSATASDASAQLASTSQSAASASENAAAASETNAAGSEASAASSSTLSASAALEAVQASASMGPVDFGVPDHWRANTSVGSWPPGPISDFGGVFLTNDPDFGNAFDFGENENYNIGPDYRAPWTPETVFEISVRFKAVNGSGTTDGSNVRLGVSLWQGDTRDTSISNIQAMSGVEYTEADGIGTFTGWISTRNLNALSPVTNGYCDDYAYTSAAPSNANNNSASFHVRSSASGDGWLILDYMQVRDVTAYVNALEAAAASETSATASALSETTAAASENAAGQSATAANTSALAANTSAGSASASETAASTSETNADGSANAAAASQSVAASNASAAAGSATGAAGSATGAAGSATGAAGSASGALTSANAAATSASSANTKATEASNSAIAANSSATTASTAASAAGVSETNAAASETSASGSATASSASALSARALELDTRFSLRGSATVSERVCMITESYQFAVEEDATPIYVNGAFNTSINRGQLITIALSVGDVVVSPKPFNASSSTGAQGIQLASYALAGKYIPIMRLRNMSSRGAYVTLYPITDGNYRYSANAINDGNMTNPTAWASMSAGGVTQFQVAPTVSDSGTVVVETDALCLVHVQYEATDKGDADLVHPAAPRLAMAGSYTAYTLAGVSHNNQIFPNSADLVSLIYGGAAGDGAGGDCEYPIPYEAMGDEYVLPMSQIIDYYIASDKATVVTVLDASGVVVGSHALAGTEAVAATLAVGAQLGSGTALSTNGPFYFSGTTPFYLRSNKGSYEFTALGYKRALRGLAGIAGLTAAVYQAQAAQTSATDAGASASAASSSAVTAGSSQVSASGAATAAGLSANAASTSKDAAAGSATGAAGSATGAAGSATGAAGSATGASGSATSASGSATAANNSKNAASGSATGAAGSESAAAGSESAAAGSASGAAGSASGAAGSATGAAGSATGAAGSATAANTSKNAAQVSEASASASETAAAGYAVTAEGASLSASASSEVSARMLTGGFARNPTFTDWDNTTPAGIRYVYGQGTFLKNTADAKYQNAIQMITASTPSAAEPYVDMRFQVSEGNLFLEPVTAPQVMITCEVELVSGSWGGAMLRTQWRGSNGVGSLDYPLDINGADPTLGLIQKFQIIQDRPSGFGAGSADWLRFMIYSTSAYAPGYLQNVIRVHSMDLQNVTSNTLAGIVQETKIGLNDVKTASIAMRAVAGSGGASLELVALSDPINGTASTARIAADDIVLDGSVLAKHLTVGTGANILRNTDLGQGLLHMEAVGQGVLGTGAAMSLRQPPASWSGPDYPTVMVYRGGPISTDGFFDVRYQPQDAMGNYASGYPVVENAFYEFHVGVSSHRSGIAIMAQWYDATGATLGTSTLDSTGNTTSSSTQPSIWPRLGGIGQAPTGAVTVRPFARINEHINSSNHYMFLHEPFLGRTKDGAELSDYSPGGQTIISGEGIKTGSIDAQHIAATSLSALVATLGLVKSGTTGARFELDDNGLRVYRADGSVAIKLGDLS